MKKIKVNLNKEELKKKLDVPVLDTPDLLAEKINTLDEKIDYKVLKNVPPKTGGHSGSTARNLWQLQDVDVATIDATDGQVLKYSNTNKRWEAGTDSNVTDHGALTGLSDDDHIQYHNDARGDARYVNVTGDTMTGALTLADLTNALNSGDYAMQFLSGISDGATAKGFIFDTTNDMATSGAEVLTICNAGTDLFHLEKKGVVLHGKMTLGGTAINAFSIMDIQGTSDLTNGTPLGQGMLNIDTTINVVGAIRRAGVFSGKGTVTGTGVLPFISGMVFQVDNQGTGTWGANPGSWLQEPAVITSRFTSQSGSSNFGYWVSNIVASSPDFQGGTPTGTYNQFQANKVNANSKWGATYGMYIWEQTGATNESAGIFIKPQGTSGIILNGDGTGSDLVFGAGKDVSFRYGGTNTELVNLVGTGYFDVQMAIKHTGIIENINTTAKTGAYTIVATDDNIVADTSGGAFTITLPASPETGRIYTILLETAGSTLTVDGNGNNINGSATLTMSSVSSAQLVFNSTQWLIKIYV